MSHFTLGVIVNHIDDVDRVIDKYIIGNENYFERLPYCSREVYINNFKRLGNIEALTDEEIARNYEIDQARFGLTETVSTLSLDEPDYSIDEGTELSE